MEISHQAIINRTMLPQATQLIRDKTPPENVTKSTANASTDTKVQNYPSPLTPRESDIDKEQLDVVVETLNKLSVLNQRIEFRLDNEINEIYIQVVERDTGEIIKQIPPAELRRLQARMGELVGMLLDKVIA